MYGARFGECRTRSVCEIVRTSSGMVARHAGPDGADEHCGGATACMHACHACMHDMHADSPWLCLLAQCVLAGCYCTTPGCQHRRFCNVSGCAVMLVSGCAVMLGIGNSLSLYSGIVLLQRVFKRRCGLATGLGLSGGGVGTIIFGWGIPFATQRLGLQGTLRVFALLVACGNAVAGCMFTASGLPPLGGDLEADPEPSVQNPEAEPQNVDVEQGVAIRTIVNTVDSDGEEMHRMHSKEGLGCAGQELSQGNGKPVSPPAPVLQSEVTVLRADTARLATREPEGDVIISVKEVKNAFCDGLEAQGALPDFFDNASQNTQNCDSTRATDALAEPRRNRASGAAQALARWCMQVLRVERELLLAYVGVFVASVGLYTPIVFVLEFAEKYGTLVEAEKSMLVSFSGFGAILFRTALSGLSDVLGHRVTAGIILYLYGILSIGAGSGILGHSFPALVVCAVCW